MILEILEYLTTPCPAWARRLGFLTEAVSLRARYGRCRKAWADHIAECRRLVLDAADLCSRRNSVAILGSGLLIETPVAELLDRFETVVLVDALFPWPTRIRCYRHRRIERIACDLTGTGEALIESLRSRPSAPLPRPRPPILPGAPFDLVVSANLLSQLPVLPLDYVETHAPGAAFSARDRENFAAGLISAHLAWLPTVAEVACLYSDIESVVHDGPREGPPEQVLPPGISMPKPDRTWAWDIAPHPEQHPRFDRRNTVAGWLAFGRPPMASDTGADEQTGHGTNLA